MVPGSRSTSTRRVAGPRHGRAAAPFALVLALCGLLLLAPGAFAAPGDTITWWNWRTTSVNESDYGSLIGGQSIGGLVIAGVTSPAVGEERTFVQGLGSGGGYIWGDTWVGGTRSTPSDLAIGPFGEPYVVGAEVSAVDGGTDYVTAAHNTWGGVAWSTTYDGPKKNDEALAVAADDFHVYVTGMSQGADGDMDIVTIKYTNTGARVWTKRYNGRWDRQDRGLQVAVRGSYLYVAGVVSHPGHGFDTVLLKYTTGGRLKWARTYDSSNGGSEWVTGLAATSSGVFLSGYGKCNAAYSSADALLLKYGSTGVRGWTKYTAGRRGGFDWWSAMAVAPGGYLNVTGSLERSGTGHDLDTASYRPSGTRRWLRKASSAGNNNDGNKAIATDIDGRTYVTGDMMGPSGDDDLSCICYAPDGTQEWWSSFGGGAGGDVGRGVAVVSSGVWVVGGVAVTDYGSDVLLIGFEK